jgi:hypothetical protein
MKTINGLNIQQISVRTIEELATFSIQGEKSLSIKLSDEQHKKLKLIAFKAGTSMSEIVRAFLVQFIDQYKKENVVDCSPESEE